MYSVYSFTRKVLYIIITLVIVKLYSIITSNIVLQFRPIAFNPIINFNEHSSLQIHYNKVIVIAN